MYALLKKMFVLIFVHMLGVGGLFKGFNWRIVLIASTFFLVNKFKMIILPIAFPDVVRSSDEEGKKKK